MTSLPPKKIAIVAGEASGDILGAGLIEHLQAKLPGATFIGVGGPRMIAAGLQSRFDMERLSVMGISEVLGRLPELLRRRRDLIDYILTEKADLYIGIDSPDFNLPIAKRLHKKGIRTAHYVSPSVWAWRQGRVKGIKATIDLMLTLLPFEAKFYEEHQMPVEFVGHPLADQIPFDVDPKKARQDLKLSLQGEVLAVLPGSRGGEVRQIWPAFLETMDLLREQRPDLQFVIPAASQARYDELAPLLGDRRDVTLIHGDSHTAMAAADVVMLASGTATLEALLLKKPMVVGYRVTGLTYAIMRHLVKTKFVSLPNLLADEELVPELIQSEMTPKALAAAVNQWLDNAKQRATVSARFQYLHGVLRRQASERAAEAIAVLLR
ncbi:MAG: lipid-A-disaccharide synthase [Alcanivoracaceae bacterium]|nr:lipid-A-disaccharide synthase [Alcanivoracaceae bacterium]